MARTREEKNNMAFIDDNADGLELDFVPAEVKKENTIVPAGKYLVRVSKVELGTNDDGDIQTAKIQLTILEGDYERRKIFARHCVKTTRPGDNMQTMQRMGREQLGELMRAAGVGGSSLAPLKDAEVIVKVTVSPARGRYDESNDVKGYEAVAGVAKAPAAANTKAAAASTSTAKAPGFMANKKPKPAEAPAPEPEDNSSEAEDT